jgi:hypothetical protein
LNASQLLLAIEERGATARARIGNDGAAVLVVAPRDAVGDLMPELKRLKPELLELLTAPLVGSGVHRWRDEQPPAPDVVALVRELEAARRGSWVIPLPSLLAIWRELQTFTGAKLTARHLGALARLRDERPDHDNAELLELWSAGLIPDSGGGAAVWVEPQDRKNTVTPIGASRISAGL